MSGIYERKAELWSFLYGLTERRTREILAADAEYSDARYFQRKYSYLEFKWEEGLLPPRQDAKFSKLERKW